MANQMEAVSSYSTSQKGDPHICANNRTISLIVHASKIILEILQHRLEPYMEREMPVEQAGFRKGRGQGTR